MSHLIKDSLLQFYFLFYFYYSASSRAALATENNQGNRCNRLTPLLAHCLVEGICICANTTYI